MNLFARRSTAETPRRVCETHHCKSWGVQSFLAHLIGPLYHSVMIILLFARLFRWGKTHDHWQARSGWAEFRAVGRLSLTRPYKPWRPAHIPLLLLTHRMGHKRTASSGLSNDIFVTGAKAARNRGGRRSPDPKPPQKRQRVSSPDPPRTSASKRAVLIKAKAAQPLFSASCLCARRCPHFS